MRYLTPKQAEATNRIMIAALIRAFGITDPNAVAEFMEERRFDVDTDAGPLSGAFWIAFNHSERKWRPGSIMLRFDNPAAAVALFGSVECNPYSGKWNWHFEADTQYIHDMLPLIIAKIERLNPRNFRFAD